LSCLDLDSWCGTSIWGNSLLLLNCFPFPVNCSRRHDLGVRVDAARRPAQQLERHDHQFGAARRRRQSRPANGRTLSGRCAWVCSPCSVSKPTGPYDRSDDQWPRTLAKWTCPELACGVPLRRSAGSGHGRCYRPVRQTLSPNVVPPRLQPHVPHVDGKVGPPARRWRPVRRTDRFVFLWLGWEQNIDGVPLRRERFNKLHMLGDMDRGTQKETSTSSPPCWSLHVSITCLPNTWSLSIHSSLGARPSLFRPQVQTSREQHSLLPPFLLLYLKVEAAGARWPSCVCHTELHLNDDKFLWDSNKVDLSKLELMAGSCVRAQNLDSNCLDFDWGLELRFMLRDFEVWVVNTHLLLQIDR
jgi:hypothetical protein